ncbi:MAG: membrane protein insertase YidC [Acholeplasmatales bacterium]|jgi:YidC/Oxa1 family membrane protein insertase|nr:membrane protein insertase YidC [Acholeplasmatales bacterium]
MKKIISVFLVCLLFLVLVSCKSDPGKINNVISSAPETIVIEESEYIKNPNFENKGPSFYFLTDLGNIVNTAKEITTTPVIHQGHFDVVDTKHSIDGNVHTVSGSISLLFPGVSGNIDSNSNPEFTYSFYVIPEVVDKSDETVVLFTYRIKDLESFKVLLGQTIKQSDLYNTIELVLVKTNGTISSYSGDSLKEAFDNKVFTFKDEHDIFNEENKFLNFSLFKTTITYNPSNYSIDFNGYVSGGELPITTKDMPFIDYILVLPISWILQFVAFGSLAIGIIITTIIVRSLAWPIYAKSNDMTLKMNIAKPEMDRVQEKFKNRKDPQGQQQMQMEMMQVYKKYKINFFGCLMPILQMPIFLAMYQVVRRIALEGGMYADKVSNRSFLGIDLASPINVFNYIFAGIVGVTMFLLNYISQKKPKYAKNTYSNDTKTSQAAQTEKTMKMVSYMMVIMMVFFSYQSKELAFYWIIGNLYSLGQTVINKKINEAKHFKMENKFLKEDNIVDAKIRKNK